MKKKKKKNRKISNQKGGSDHQIKGIASAASPVTSIRAFSDAAEPEDGIRQGRRRPAG